MICLTFGLRRQASSKDRARNIYVQLDAGFLLAALTIALRRTMEQRCARMLPQNVFQLRLIADIAPHYPDALQRAIEATPTDKTDHVSARRSSLE